jgi:hypothetical protein
VVGIRVADIRVDGSGAGAGRHLIGREGKFAEKPDGGNGGNLVAVLCLQGCNRVVDSIGEGRGIVAFVIGFRGLQFLTDFTDGDHGIGNSRTQCRLSFTQ